MSYLDLVYPEWTVEHDRDRSLRAAERYELERAMRTLDERRRAERKQRRRHRSQRYLRLVLGRVA